MNKLVLLKIVEYLESRQKFSGYMITGFCGEAFLTIEGDQTSLLFDYNPNRCSVDIVEVTLIIR